MENEQIKTSDKNAWVYFFLMYFFGILGIHKFYLNKTGVGILYLFTGGVLGIGVLGDLLSIFFVKVKDKSGYVLEGAASLKIVALISIALLVVFVIVIASSLL